MTLTSLPASARSVGKPQTTVIVEKTAWGPILALAGKWTVYRFVKDGKDKSNCFGACAVAWPPVLLASGQKTAIGIGVQHLGAISRGMGAWQVTYEGIPLYTFIKDKKPGQINGNVKDKYGQWWVVNPAHPLSVPTSSGAPATTVPGGGVAY